ncbi:TIR domain-containing protein [Longimicrobium terrae]|uniref:TIR domain-containing protein n=1 Tax=Longimicrobium terrae TaxID=1639882 RepID=A0A841GTW0_9BACT|nr:hypothetical protein [Longimicrobium terrae]MBB6070089.1 hypothetical protein [Longimicrobium terrae]NNC32992.1 toll/interleukin-1 receptor domain-containing protein [Longimicrobium terrae]
MRIFVSYTLRDNVLDRATLVALDSYLREFGDPYIDLLHNPGEDHQRHVLTMLRSASLVLAIVTPKYDRSEWVKLELALAHQHQIPIMSVDAPRGITGAALSALFVSEECTAGILTPSP